jgi:hypothetical protein
LLSFSSLADRRRSRAGGCVGSADDVPPGSAYVEGDRWSGQEAEASR